MSKASRTTNKLLLRGRLSADAKPDDLLLDKVAAGKVEDAVDQLLVQTHGAADALTTYERIRDRVRRERPNERDEFDCELGRRLLQSLASGRALNESDRGRAVYVARLFEGAKRFADAGEAYVLGGSLDAARAAFEQAGEPERYSALVRTEATAEEEQRAVRGAIEAFEWAMNNNAREEAWRALDLLDRIGAHDAKAREIIALHRQRELKNRSSLRMSVNDKPFIAVGVFPFVIGRGEGDAQLADESVSRRHARIFSDGDGFVIADQNSSNGTRVGGVRIDGEHALMDRARVGLGKELILDARVAAGVLRLTVATGREKGLVIVAAKDEVPIEEAGIVLRFPNGRPTVVKAERPTRCNAAHAIMPLMLLANDELWVNGRRLVIHAT